jgi:hypothetical protein
MKKIFGGIGMLVAAFSIFFFLLIADKMVYYNNETIYDFKLSRSIPGQELKKYAEATNLMIRLVNFKNTSFGNNQLEVTFINPESNVSLGKQPSVFPKDNIIYKAFDEKIEKKIKYFTVETNDYKKIEKITSLLRENGYSVDLDKSEPINFNLGMLFSPLNLGFFALLTLLLILSIATYYVYRLKEIGVLKLNGLSNGKISFGLLYKLLIHLYLFSLLLIIPFGMYVIWSDVSKIILYAKIYFLLCCFLAFVFLLSAFIGTFFIQMVNEVGAIKNKRNNKLIFYALIIFKLGIVTLLLLSIKTSSENIYKLNANIQSIDKLKKYNFHTIRTSVVPDEVLHEKLDQLVDSLEDRHVYNYSSAEDMTDIIELQDYQSNGKLSEHDDFDFVSISPNVLELLHVLDEKGNKIEASQIDPKADTLLVPIHRKNDIKMILNHFQFEEGPKIMYIKNGQVNNDILWPGYYIYDSIYYIHQLHKTLYLNSGEVLLDKESAEIIEQELGHLGIDTYSIVVDSQNQEYNTLKANLQLDLFESLFHMIINLLSFLLCVVSIVIIFLELRKKELGVYKLIGKYPIKAIGKFVALNGVITIGAVLVVNPMFLFLMLIEGTIYGIFIYKYMRKKAVLALKGA